LMHLTIFIVVVTISPDRCVKNTHWP